MPDYISWIRERVGQESILLNAAGVVVFDHLGRVLLQKRSKDEDLWGFPGGAMELGESAEETAVRELREETGLDVRVDSLLGVYTRYTGTFPNGDQAQVVLIIFKGSIMGGELKADGKETFDLAFFDLDAAPKLFNTQHNDILADVRAGRSGVYR